VSSSHVSSAPLFVDAQASAYLTCLVLFPLGFISTSRLYHHPLFSVGAAPSARKIKNMKGQTFEHAIKFIWSQERTRTPPVDDSQRAPNSETVGSKDGHAAQQKFRAG
jgi:hypothetical protein